MKIGFLKRPQIIEKYARFCILLDKYFEGQTQLEVIK